MAWAKNGTPDTLGSSGDVNEITDLTAKNFNLFLWHKIANGSCVGVFTFNSNTNSVYTRRRSLNGGVDVTNVSQANIKTDISDVNDSFCIFYACSISGEEKLQIMFQVNRNAAGATSAPNRVEYATKFVPSPDADITSIETNNTGGGSYDTNTNLSALGTD